MKLIGTISFILICSLSIQRISASDVDSLLSKGEVAVAEKKSVDARVINYYLVKDSAKKTVAYIFFSKDFAPKIKGFRGPISMLIKTDADGVVKDFKVLKSRETKFHMTRILKSKSKLLNHNIFATNGPEIDSVSGATVSSTAMIKTLAKSGQGFAEIVLGKNVSSTTQTQEADEAEKSPLDNISTSNNPPPATVRNVDQEKYKRLIKENKISGKKAEYYTSEDKPSTQSRKQ